jgi:hypothetical protein
MTANGAPVLKATVDVKDADATVKVPAGEIIFGEGTANKELLSRRSAWAGLKSHQGKRHAPEGSLKVPAHANLYGCLPTRFAFAKLPCIGIIAP